MTDVAKELTFEDKVATLWKEGYLQVRPDFSNVKAENVERRWAQRYEVSDLPMEDKLEILWKDGTMTFPPDFKSADPEIVDKRWYLRENTPQIGARIAKERARAQEDEESVDN